MTDTAPDISGDADLSPPLNADEPDEVTAGDDTGADDDDVDDDGIEALIANPALYEQMAQEDDDSETDDDEPDHEPSANAEAAKWRVKCREAETRLQAAADEVARVQDLIEGMWKAEVERLASSRLAAGEDIWLGGVQINDLLDSDERVDPAKVAKAVGELLARRPHWAQPAPRTSGLRSGASNAPDIRSASWAGAIRSPE